MILHTPEPGATRLKQAWLRLREDDRRSADETALPPMEILAMIVEPVRAKGAKSVKAVRILKHQLAMDAKARYGKAADAALALGVSRYTFYRWLKKAA